MYESLENAITQIVTRILAQEKLPVRRVPVGISNRHVHLTPEALETLFGQDYKLQVRRELSQPGHYAAEETVTIVGPKGVFQRVRVLGPVRRATQVEISRTDCYSLGINPVVEESGVIKPTPCLAIVGPLGAITVCSGVMVALRHIHINPRDAADLGLSDGDLIKIRTGGRRSIILENVKVRVNDKFITEVHLDLDEANAADLRTGDLVEIITTEPGKQGDA